MDKIIVKDEAVIKKTYFCAYKINNKGQIKEKNLVGLSCA